MRVLVVQLSDIHVRQSSDAVLLKGEALQAAIQSIDPGLECCILLLSGDLAFSGADDEYSLVYEFLEALRAGVANSLPRCKRVYTIAIPGNHDCNFRLDTPAREMIREKIASEQPRTVDPSIAELCMSVQRSFFDLRDTIAPVEELHLPGKLYYEYRIPSGDTYIEIRCINTAWLSQLHESLGTLFVPVDQIPERNDEAAVSITMLHHPFHWMPTGNRRELQARVESVSDVIFTGHEHAHTRRVQSVSTGETNEFIEGAALQVTEDSDESSFNAVLIGVQDREQRFYRFEWDGVRYASVSPADWEPLQVNRLRTREEFVLSSKFAEELDDPGAGLEKAGFGRPRLSDLFVHPELRELSLGGTDARPSISSTEVLEESIGSQHLLISGPEQCGKTALAKTLFQRLRRKGFVPLLIDGSEFVPQSGDRLYEQLYRIADSQYQHASTDRFRQLEMARRVIIVDGFHRLRLKPGRAETFLRELETFAGRVILLANDLAYAVGEILRARQVIEERSSYTHFAILPFGYSKRTELTTRWLLLPGQLDDEELARRLSLAEDRMEVVLGKNFVPAFPIFILSMLQGLDSETSIDTNASTYGYFYELLIKAALARSATQAEFNIRVTYLTRLALHLLQTKRRDITESELRAFHEAFEKSIDITIPRSAFIADLEERRILVRYSDTFEFKYTYCYYYFVARALQRQIGTAEIRAEVAQLSEDLADEENANILLFLVHLTDDELVIRRMLESAARYFATDPVATLDSDAAFLESSERPQVEFEYEDKNFYEARREAATERDAIAQRGGEADFELSDADTPVAREIRAITGAIKSLQILGQTLKNFPALDARLKEEIALECYRLGFRTLGRTLGQLKAGEREIVELMTAALKAEFPNASEDKILRRANSVVFGLALLASCGIVKRISQAVGSPHIEATYNRVSAALPSTPTRLVNLSIRMDQIRGFPQGDIVRFAEELKGHNLPRAVLSWLVWDHVTLFPVRYDDKQKVFSALGIKYTPRIGARIGSKLLGPGRGT